MKFTKLEGKNLIAIIAPKGTGKSTFAHSLSNFYKYTPVVSFADPIRDMLSPMYADVYYGDKNQSDIFGLDISLRKALISLGMWGRSTLSEDIWIHYLNEYLNNDSHLNFIIDDLRFKNELDYLIDQEAIIILLTRLDIYKRPNYIDETELLAHDLIDIANNQYKSDYDPKLIKLIFNYPKFIHINVNTSIDLKEEFYSIYIKDMIKKGLLPSKEV